MAVRRPEYVVIGAGSGGSVVAARLAESGSGVCVLEAGGSDRYPAVLIPAGLMRMPASRYWMYTVEPDPTRLNRRDLWASGKLLGGSSSVNAMLWVRGNPADFDEWATLGAEGWDYQSLLPLMRDLEAYDGGGNEYRGGRGPQAVSDTRLAHPTAQLWLTGAQEIGLPLNADYNGRDQIGVGWAQVSQRNGLRHNAARAYLHPAERRYRSLQVLTGASAHRILISKGRAVGVEYAVRGRLQQVFAEREVIVCAGAIGTPALLMRSGIGDPRQLAEHGIETTVDLPAVGANLQEHPTARLRYKVTEPTLNTELDLAGITRGASEFILHRRGPVTATLCNALGFGVLDGGAARPDYQLAFSPLATSTRPGTSDAKVGARMAKDRVVSSFACLLHPRARGAVTLRSADPAELPRIQLSYLENAQDVRELIAACRIARSIMDSRPVRPHVVREESPGPEAGTDSQWRAYLEETTMNCAHWVGTARMGSPNDPGCVVDPRLRVRGISGLRVADASVMPTITSGNTNAPTILIAEKAAQLIRDG